MNEPSGLPAETAAGDRGLGGDHPALFSASTVKRYSTPFSVWNVWDRVDAARELIAAGEPVGEAEVGALAG